jgi:hypothetical protein
MSVYSSDYSLSSVNSHNENIYNTQKLEKSSKYRLRKIFKKILKTFIKNTSSKKSRKQQTCNCRNTTYDFESEICDNSANETLETRILDEIRDCGDNSAVFVYGENEYLIPVNKNQPYVPVHFARTEAGTFFWTSFNANNSCVAEQLPELKQNQFDRWVQA